MRRFEHERKKSSGEEAGYVEIEENKQIGEKEKKKKDRQCPYVSSLRKIMRSEERNERKQKKK